MIKQISVLENLLQKMEKEGQVKPFLANSLELLNQISQRVKAIRERKIREPVSPNEMFEFYHLSLVSSIVLDSMKVRLEQTEEAHDNPVSALDSLRVLPNLKDAISKLQLKEADGTFLDFAGFLQLNASKHNLFKLNPKQPEEIRKTLTEVANEISISQQYG